ncbi:hypothetical protein K437DRAFT_258027 [Tilletiaria anomala UBC 951]|uniref:Uncharacterized protein n=1 Tax=Tilletiaria anomala (strain ATCC 24038 / CBS 436.72 / UBC 951) TaxID=1037660 RepID=A0A066VP54_TILAU|nr:uncharacterized protein K437DRAFT_258027 [Tilletiaria anomala UBC 951]KDN42088.1 hypothetical protein K437DRAFT_258027 [Tilletiaria anomala UBC 951]
MEARSISVPESGRAAVTDSLKRILPCLLSEPPLLPLGYKGRDVALRHTFLNADVNDREDYLLGGRQPCGATSPLQEIDRLKSVLEFNPSLEVDDFIKNVKFRVGQYGLEVAVELGAPENVQAMVIVILEQTSAEYLSLPLGIQAGAAQEQEESVSLRYAALALPGHLQGPWFASPERALAAGDQGSVRSAGKGDDEAEGEASTRMDIITSAEDFWAGVSSDDDSPETQQSLSALNGAAGVAQRRQRKREEDEDYWSRYDSVDTAVGNPSDPAAHPLPAPPETELDASLLMSLKGAWKLFQRSARAQVSDVVLRERFMALAHRAASAE